MRCEFCGTQKWERWKGNTKLTGIRCINKCLGSYKIDIIPVKYPKHSSETSKKFENGS